MATDTATATQVHARATVHPDKAKVVAELAESFRSSGATVLTDYRGLTVKQITDLRVALGADTTYAVVKNTLTKLAADQSGLTELGEHLFGPTAIAFIKGDPVDAAKALRTFGKAHPALIVKGGVMDGKILSPAEIGKLADLESREVLLAKLAGAMKASLSNAVYMFAAPLQKTAQLAGALQAKAQEDPSVIGGAGEAPAAAATEDAPAEEAPAEQAPAVEAPEASATETSATETSTTE